MDEISKTITYIALSVVGALFSLVAYGMQRFMSDTRRKLEKHDERLDKLEVRLGEMLARHNEQIGNIFETLKEIKAVLTKLDDKINAK